MGWISSSHLTGTSDIHWVKSNSDVGMFGDELITETVDFVPPALFLKPHNSVSTYMSLMPPPMLPSSGARVNSWECMDHYEHALSFQVPSISPRQTESLLIFMARCCGDSSSQYWCSGLGILFWGRNPSLLRVPL